MRYAMDDDLGYDPDAVEAAMHAREEAAWEEEPEPAEDRVADSMRWTPPAAGADREAGPVPFELTELGAGRAVADQMTEREVGPGYLEYRGADREPGS